MELGPKFGQIVQQDKPNTKTQLLLGSSGARTIILSNYTDDKPNTTAQLLQGSSGARAIIWSNFPTDKRYSLQNSYSQASVELEPKFGQIILQDKPNTTAKLP